MALSTPGASTSFPAGQKRQQYGRDWGNYTTVATMPNGSGNALAATDFRLEAGDRCYLSLSGSEAEYLCVSAGTAGGSDAVWIPNTGQGPWSSVLYVDNVRGVDATGQRGNANRPYATIQAALNAAVTEDTVYIAPQAFAITTQLTVPATVVRCGLVGFYPRNNGTTTGIGTRIVATGCDAFNLGANLGLSRITLRSLTIAAASAGFCAIRADGSLYAVNTFITQLSVEDCVINGDVLSKYTGAITFLRGTGGAALTSWSFTSGSNNTIFVAFDGASLPVTVDHDASDPLARTTVVQAIQVRSFTVLGGSGSTAFVTWKGQSSVFVDQQSEIGGLKGSSLSVNGARAPGVTCAGYVGGSNTGVLDLAGAGSEIPDTATALTLDFRGTRMMNVGSSAGVVGPSTVKFKVAGAAANAQAVKLDDTTLLPSATVTADANINITGRGASWPLATLTTPAGTGTLLPPSPLLLAPVAVAANPQAITYPCRVPAGSVNAMVAYQSDNVASIPSNVITARTQLGFSAGLLSPAGASAIPAPYKFSGVLTGAVGAVAAYAGDNPLAVALVPVAYPSGRAERLANLHVNVTANALASATTVTVYKNGVATTITVTVGAAATGVFSDTTHTADFAIDDKIDLRLDNNAGGVAALIFSATLDSFPNTAAAGNLTASVMFPG